MAPRKGGTEDRLCCDRLGEGEVSDRCLRGIFTTLKKVSQTDTGPPPASLGFCTHPGNPCPPPHLTCPGPSSSHPGGSGARQHRGRTAPVPRRCRHVPAISLGFGRGRERERRDIQSRVKKENLIIPQHQLPQGHLHTRALKPLPGGRGGHPGGHSCCRRVRPNQTWEQFLS